MGNFSALLESSRSDDHSHLETSIDTLHLRVDPQSLGYFELAVDDHIQFQLPDDQSIELLILDLEGKSNQALLIPQHQAISYQETRGKQTQEQLQQGTLSSQKLHSQLNQYAIRPDMLMYNCGLTSCEDLCFQAASSLRLFVFNTGPDTPVTAQNAIDEIKVTVIKAQPLNAYLPEALAVPLEEILIPRACAKTYHVKAGQWIQIIDVAGKQCSDFLAFDAQALGKGLEIGLDATVTRTILGQSKPQPGLHGQFFAADLQPLVEIFQDTVGRHDMFLSACSPKFYNDAGYFNHISCTENFNQVLAPYAIQRRDAWPAINFFYNTSIEDCGTIRLDEPWSQPGDYVLLKAKRDLLCASSACPDDIDASNGWMPTDIFIRIYDEDQSFPRSQHYRIDPKERPRMTQSSGFFSQIQTLTSKISEYRGHWIADEYDGWGAKAEYVACRERVAMIDLSALRKFDITGPDAEAFLHYALTRNVRKLAIGEIVYSACCLDSGGMIDDGTLFRMGEHNFRWICGDEYSGTWLKALANTQGYRVSIRNASSNIHNIAVQGPLSRALLKELIWTPQHQPTLEHLAWFHFTLGKLGDEHGIPLMISRTGYTGELGFEIWCHPEHAPQLWDKIWQAGQAYGIAPLGFKALDMLRIEAGLIFAEHEFTNQINPYEAGIGFTVPMKTKHEDFLGKQAMQQQSSESRHQLMGLILDKSEPAQHGDIIYSGRFAVGVVTSATNSPLLGQQIALCRLAPQYANVGTQLEIGQLDGFKKRLNAQVVALPFYDPTRSRIKS